MNRWIPWPHLRARLGVTAAGVILPVCHLFAASSMPSAAFTLVDVPARIADLGFAYLRPADFRAVELPEEQPDFNEPTKFYPLQVAMANYGAVVFSVAARPAYEEGTVEDWAGYLVRENQLQPVSMQSATIGGLRALIVEATQEAEVGPMRVRVAFMEDGTRLLNLTVMAPEAIWTSVEPTLQHMLISFRLAAPRGASVPLTRAEAAKVAAETASAAEPVQTTSSDPSPKADEAGAAEASIVPAAELALSDDARSLDPDHPLNARLRDQGVGLTPRVLSVDDEVKVATLGAGALMATFQLPYGWHAIDDGQRVLVFDASGRIQINLNLREDGGDSHQALRALRDEALQEQPSVDAELIAFAADLPGLVLRNYRVDDEVLVQAFVFRRVRDDHVVHVARVTAAPDDLKQAMNVTQLIMQSLDVVPLAAGGR